MTDALPENLTIGESYGAAMEITDQAEADAYFQRLVDRSMTYFRKTRTEAEALERQNLGYYAGYYDSETRHRVEKLYRCAHPVFGSISAVGAPTPEEALQAGKDMAKRPF
jgi:hypothetical protein